MTMLALRYAQDMKEFMPSARGIVYHGSCQQLALLGGMHAVRPDLFPMDGAHLGYTVQWMINAGLAEPSGSSKPRAGRAWLTAGGWPFQEYPVSELDATIATFGGRMPIILEYAHGANLPGDEVGLEYHYNCIVGYDPDTQEVLSVDGDNAIVRRSPSGYGPLCSYSTHQLHDAVPVNVLVIKVGNMISLNQPEVAKYYRDDGKGNWNCPTTGYTIQAGSMLDYYRTMPYDLSGLSALGLVISDEIAIPGTEAKVQLYERGAIAYDPKREYDNPPGNEGKVYLAHVDKNPALALLKKIPSR